MQYFKHTRHYPLAKARETTGWTRCMAEDKQHLPFHASAHGGVVHRDVCPCGYVRFCEVNGTARAFGRWHSTTEEER